MCPLTALLTASLTWLTPAPAMGAQLAREATLESNVRAIAPAQQAKQEREGKDPDDPTQANVLVFPSRDFARIEDIASSMRIPAERIFVDMGLSLGMPIGATDRFVMLSAEFVNQASNLELAFIIAHEYAHVVFSHPLRRTELAYRLAAARCWHCIAEEDVLATVSRGYRDDLAAIGALARTHELEADAWALRRLLAAGYQVTSSQELLGSSLFNAEKEMDESSHSHPSLRTRLTALDALLNSAEGRPTTPPVSGS